MKIVRLLSVLLLIGWLVVSCARRPAEKSIWTRVTGDTFDVVYPSDLGGEFRDELLDIEAKLPSFVAKAVSQRYPLDFSVKKVTNTQSYKRQYLFTGDPNQSNMFINCLHESADEVESGEWLEEWIEVIGGGDNYLSIRYDRENGEFIDLHINSPM